MENTTPKVRLHTSAGDIVLELYPEDAPVSVENFLKYVNDGYYEGKIFHRVIRGFMIQGGGMDATMREGKPRPERLSRLPLDCYDIFQITPLRAGYQKREVGPLSTCLNNAQGRCSL